jgi:hypothetical protein
MEKRKKISKKMRRPLEPTLDANGRTDKTDILASAPRRKQTFADSKMRRATEYTLRKYVEKEQI